MSRPFLFANKDEWDRMVIDLIAKLDNGFALTDEEAAVLIADMHAEECPDAVTGEMLYGRSFLAGRYELVVRNKMPNTCTACKGEPGPFGPCDQCGRTYNRDARD